MKILEKDKEHFRIETFINFLYKKLKEKNEVKIEYYSFSREEVIKLSNVKEWEQIIKPTYLDKWDYLNIKIDTTELLKVQKEDYKELLKILLEIESTFLIISPEEFIRLNKKIEKNLLELSKVDILKKYEYMRYYYAKIIREKYLNYLRYTANEKLEKELKEIEGLSVYYRALKQ